jgi:hypothetical protein
MTRTEVSNYQDVIDSRDVIARIEELQGFRDDAKTTAEEKQARIDELEANQTDRTEAEQDEIDDCRDYLTENTHTDAKGATVFLGVDYGEDEHDELLALESLQEEAEGCSDWQHGKALIRESYFERYAQELADDLGYLNKDNSWPYTCIDWEQAARELSQDYTTVTFDGVDYMIRS